MKLLGTAAVLLVLKLKSTQASEPGMNCIDKETGLCELEGLFTYCYLNVDTGEYNCDKDNKCAAKSETLRTMTGGGGCFGTNCCCKPSENTPMCNYAFYKAARVQHKKNVTNTQSCMRQMVTDTTTTEPKDCDDAYCYTLRFTSAGLTGGYMSGCHSLLRYYLHSDSNKMSVDYKFIQSMSEMTCAQIFQEKAEELGVDVDEVPQACHSVDSVDSDNNKVEGNFCCCKGEDMCNDNLWPLSQDLGDFSPGMGSGMSRNSLISLAVFGGGMAVAMTLLFRI